MSTSFTSEPTTQIWLGQVCTTIRTLGIMRKELIDETDKDIIRIVKNAIKERQTLLN